MAVNDQGPWPPHFPGFVRGLHVGKVLLIPSAYNASSPGQQRARWFGFNYQVDIVQELRDSQKGNQLIMKEAQIWWLMCYYYRQQCIDNTCFKSNLKTFFSFLLSLPYVWVVSKWDGNVIPLISATRLLFFCPLFFQPATLQSTPSVPCRLRQAIRNGTPQTAKRQVYNKLISTCSKNVFAPF